MSKYIEIIQVALQNAYDCQPFNEPINEQTTIKIIAAVDVAMEYLADHYRKAFHDIVNEIRAEARNNENILSMLSKLMTAIHLENCGDLNE